MSVLLTQADMIVRNKYHYFSRQFQILHMHKQTGYTKLVLASLFSRQENKAKKILLNKD